MFSFLRKKEKKNYLADLKVDIHSHLIPGIDDGAKDLEDSIELIKKLKELGYSKLITTPHIMSDSYPNSKDTILQGLDILKKELKKEAIVIEIEAAAEHYLDENFLNILEKQEVLPIAKEYLLFETSYISKPINLEDLIYEIKINGYKPILAHPERYRYIKNLDLEYSRLKELGVYLQVNINSLNGYYGKDAHKKSQFLLERGYIDFLGTDTHHTKHLNNLEVVARNCSIWKNLLEKNKILNLSLLNS
jgi:tyrosine-protein phosphatase YwqE